jgi:hypothetical protein
MDLLTAIDWKNAVAGALVGASPTLIGLAYRYYSLATRRQWRKYVGEFWLYHPSGTVPGEIREKNIRFKRSLSGRIKATMDQPPPVGLLFEGFLSLSRGRIVYINLEESTQKERIQIILIDQLDPKFGITTGVLSGLNLNNRPLAVKIVLSRTRIRAKGARGLLTAPDRILSDDQAFPSRA